MSENIISNIKVDGVTYALNDPSKASIESVEGLISISTENNSSITLANSKLDQLLSKVEGSDLDTSDATALASQILLGKTAYVNGIKVVGTLDLSQLLPENIVSGVVINDIIGTHVCEVESGYEYDILIPSGFTGIGADYTTDVSLFNGTTWTRITTTDDATLQTNGFSSEKWSAAINDIEYLLECENANAQYPNWIVTKGSTVILRSAAGPIPYSLIKPWEVDNQSWFGEMMLPVYGIFTLGGSSNGTGGSNNGSSNNSGGTNNNGDDELNNSICAESGCDGPAVVTCSNCGKSYCADHQPVSLHTCVNKCCLDSNKATQVCLRCGGVQYCDDHEVCEICGDALGNKCATPGCTSVGTIPIGDKYYCSNCSDNM